MTHAEFPPVTDLVPHRGRMCFLSHVEDAGDGYLAVAVRIDVDHVLMVPGQGVPTYAGLEMMAQAISAMDGLNRWRDGLSPTIGFLLGCQRYRTFRDWLIAGEEYRVTIRCRLEGEELGSFDCRLETAGGEIVASGTVNVFRPKNVGRFLSKGGEA